MSWKVAATLAYYPADTVSTWKLQAEYADAYKAANQVPICRTVVVTPVSDCVNASPMAPMRQESLVGRVEYRRFFPFAGSTRGVGIAPMASVDALSGDRGFEFPIFLALGDDSVVLPGVKFEYARDSSKAAEDDESIGFAVFLKTSFGL